MTPEQYIAQRLDDQINWYSNKSTKNKRAFLWLRSTEVIAAAAIPFLSGFAGAEMTWPIYTGGGLGVLITICAAMLSLLQLQERWTEYRTTSESLKKEKFLFLTGVEPYNGPNAFGLLVQRAETLISKENTNWAQYMMKPEKEDKNG